MDFWSKTGKGKPYREEYVSSVSNLCMTKRLHSDSERRPLHSALSSPLTSLSSVDPMDEDDIEDIAPRVSSQDSKIRFDLDQLKAALVCTLS